MYVSVHTTQVGIGRSFHTFVGVTLLALGLADKSANAQTVLLPNSNSSLQSIKSSLTVPRISPGSTAITAADDGLDANLSSFDKSGSIKVSQTNNPLGFTPVDLFPDILDNATSLSTANLTDNAVLTSDNYSKHEFKWNLVLSLANQLDSNNRIGTNPFAASASPFRTDIASPYIQSNYPASGFTSTITQFGNASFPHSLEVLNALLTANSSNVAAPTLLTATSTTGNFVSLGENPDLTFSPVPEPAYMLATCALLGLMFAAFRRKISCVCL